MAKSPIKLLLVVLIIGAIIIYGFTGLWQVVQEQATKIQGPSQYLLYLVPIIFIVGGIASIWELIVKEQLEGKKE